MKNKTNITTLIDTARLTLSEPARLSLWQSIKATLPDAVPTVAVITSSAPTERAIPSPYFSNQLTYKTMAAFLILLTLVLGSGGATAFASDAAKPGDVLFPLDRALENIRLSLAASTSTRVALTQKFTAERMQELRDIINEEVTVLPASSLLEASSTVTDMVTTVAPLTITATVFTDTTVVKLTLNGQVFYFQTTATTTPDIVVAIESRFPVVTDTQVSEALTVVTKARASQPADQGIVVLTNAGGKRISTAVEAVIQFLDHTSDSTSERKEVLTQLATEMAGITGTTTISRDHDTIELASDTGHVKIHLDNGDGTSSIAFQRGATEIKVEGKDNDYEIHTEKKDEVTTPTPTQTLPAVVMTATIFTDTTVVALTFGPDTVYFSTSATTRTAIMTAIKEHFSALTADQIDTALTVATQNRASLPEDSGSMVIPPTATSTTEINTDQYRDDEGKKHDNENETAQDETSYRAPSVLDDTATVSYDTEREHKREND